MAETAAYGSWKSPISSDLITRSSIGLGEIQLGEGGMYWIEMRPAEKGRYVVVAQYEDSQAVDMLPVEHNARSRVHEYGGGSYLVAGNNLYFTGFKDQQLYLTREGKTDAITDAANSRFADFVFDEQRQRLISVMETHPGNGAEAVNTLVAINLKNIPSEPVILASGADFYSNPRISPDGTQLAWIAWNHPNMPWDDSELWLANIDTEGGLVKPRKVSGGEDESVFQPEWSADGVLFFVSDKSGWWNLYRYQGGEVQTVTRMEAEFGVPQWSFRESTYAFIDAKTIVCSYSQRGISYLATVNTESLDCSLIDTPYTDIESVQANAEYVVFLAASPTRFPEIVRYDLRLKTFEVIKVSSDLALDSAYIATPETIEFPTANHHTAHAFFYPPQNKDYAAPEDELPPLLVFSHGGPTGMARSGLKMVIQYFTSRGIAVVDVNYGGSSGYGRAYRQRLHGNWGITDVEDCIHAARYLAAKGLVDVQRLAIRGGSAGGFTTLAALTFHDVFKAGCSRYGVSDLEALARETHKFESRYLDNLVGPYPEQQAVYRERSPIHAADKLSCPVIFFQGLEDKIVLPNQAEMMVEKLVAKGIAVAYIPFEGEQHGFRQAENIKRALDGEFYFFSEVFDFTPADTLPELEILNHKSIQ